MRGFLLGLLTSSVLATPVLALDVTFSGTLANTCSLSLSTPGTLALNSDGNAMSSDAVGGLPALIAILSVGSHTVTVAAPTRTGSPGGYDPTGEQITVSYFGLGGLGLINQAYTAAQTTFGISTLPLSVLTLNNRLTNTAGFVAGTYSTRTVVTCS